LGEYLEQNGAEGVRVWQEILKKKTKKEEKEEQKPCFKKKGID